ncbi:MAG: zinc ribbon domain-containing protein, partial [Eubacteriales bacterium]|nr:zinc ribbon domain-containing protein [Eubacteriales bacterium]
ETSRSTSELGGAFASLQSAMEGYATAMGKNIKVCPKCDETVSADEKFCPHCGAKLPEISLAEGALCPKCGKQNTIGTKFCSGCGEKLPQAVYEEEAARENDAAELNLFREKLPQYPVWSCGGYDYTIEEGDEWFSFTVTFGSDFEAEKGVNKYRELLKENGFREAGEYPSIEHLYKMVNGKCYHVDTEHCWNGDANCPTIYFNIDEPTGGFNYVKPEPKPEISGLSALKG